MSTTSTDREILVDVGNDFRVKVARVVFGALFYGRTASFISTLAPSNFKNRDLLGPRVLSGYSVHS